MKTFTRFTVGNWRAVASNLAHDAWFVANAGDKDVSRYMNRGGLILNCDTL